MRLSRYFVPTLKETPAEAHIVSHQLMLRAGLVHKVTSGIYAWLPLGLRVMDRIGKIIRKHQDRIGCLEVMMPTIQPADLWQRSGRYEDYGQEMLRLKDRHGRDMLYGPTAEEVITDIFQHHVHSYRDVPKCFYNIQWKFRDEIRPRFGVMRGREFLMKDGYSFDLDAAGAKRTYMRILESYLRTFDEMGLRAIPVRADTGPIGGDLSHEFHILAETGESTLYYDKKYHQISWPLALEDMDHIYAAADDKHIPDQCPLAAEDLQVSRGIEVGHIFYFGTKYSTALEAYLTTSQGQRVPAEMGSYGIGVSRLVGAVIEASHDEKGIIWHPRVAPFQGALLNAASNDSWCQRQADDLYEKLVERGADILFDDRDVSPGVKFSDMDLIGLPYQIILGKKTAQEGLAQIKNRKTGQIEHLNLDQVVERALLGTMLDLF